MLLADIEMRRTTGGRMGHGACLRAVVTAGGDVTRRWTSARIVAVCDKAAEVPILARLAADHARRGSPLDYPGLWRKLGVRKVGRGVAYDDKAPWAAIRRAILAPR